MKIAVVGLGVVGGAVYNVFKSKVPEQPFVLLGYDKFKEEFQDWNAALTADVMFLCLPTLTKADGNQDLSAVHDVMEKLRLAKYKGVVVLKSTVLPGTTKGLADFYGLRCCHNPEFLRASYAVEDFREQMVEIISGEERDIQVASMAYGYLPWKSIFGYTNHKVTEMAKYMRNDMRATLVSFWNEQRELCIGFGIDFEEAKSAMMNIGGSSPVHSKVPGPDGKLGFGGECFIKDTIAMSKAGKELSVPTEVLNATIKSNQRRRPEEYKDKYDEGVVE